MKIRTVTEGIYLGARYDERTLTAFAPSLVDQRVAPSKARSCSSVPPKPGSGPTIPTASALIKADLEDMGASGKGSSGDWRHPTRSRQKLSLRLARDGWSVLLFDRDPKVEETAARIASELELGDGTLLYEVGSVAGKRTSRPRRHDACELRRASFSLLANSRSIAGVEIDLISRPMTSTASWR